MDPDSIRALDKELLSQDDCPDKHEMLVKVAASGTREANRRTRDDWSRITSREEWEQFRDERLERLRRSLGDFPPLIGPLRAMVTGKVDGDGFIVENLVYESRPGVLVSANLYLPGSAGGKIPCFVIVPSHHTSKEHGELQDMGMTWARSGCAVIVMDHLGYGERREHRPGRKQDYRFRYINGIQLNIIGESLLGWMAWDVMRSIDILFERVDVDRDRLVILGSVAGGGDVAAVVSALDSRVKALVVFNFGGPQSETAYPLPPDAEVSFNEMGTGSWESTRNLYRSGIDGFPPWVIVAATAPRPLNYAHEFSWDSARDPVWQRLCKVFAFYNAEQLLSSCHGRGRVSLRPPEATHCTHIGRFHRAMIYPALENSLGIPCPEEYEQRVAHRTVAVYYYRSQGKLPLTTHARDL